MEYTITTAARVAWGISAMRGASSSMVARAAAAVVRPATWVRAPARRFTAVCEVPPPAGMAPNRPPTALPRPVASSSRFGSGTGSPRPAKARAAAMVSVKLIRAMPSAPGQSCSIRPRLGAVNDGRPWGM